MNVYNSIWFLIFIKFYVQSETINDYALVVEKTLKEFRFLKFFLKHDENNVDFYVQDDKFKGIYLKCPHESKNEYLNALYTQRYVEDGFVLTKKICKKFLQPMIFQVANIHRPFCVFHIGYQVNVEDTNIIQFPEYVSMPQNLYLIPIIALYRDKYSNYIVAVQYKISLTNTSAFPDYSPFSKYEKHSSFPNSPDTFFKHQQNYFYYEFPNGDYKKYFNIFKRKLIPMPLVDENDFAQDLLRRAVYYNVLIAPMWLEYKEIWRKIEHFVRELASALEEMTITTGIGNILKVSTHSLKWNNRRERIFVPELFWKALEYKKSGELKGIFIIMHNDPFTPLDQLKPVCQENFCIKNKLWSPSPFYAEVEKQVYCCEINNESIKNLGVEFLFEEQPALTVEKSFTFPSEFF